MDVMIRAGHEAVLEGVEKSRFEHRSNRSSKCKLYLVTLKIGDHSTIENREVTAGK